MSRKPTSLDNYILEPETEEKAPAQKQQSERVRRSSGLYVKVEMQLLKPRKGLHWFRSRERLLIYILFRSKLGQRGVRMTAAVSAELDMPDRTRQRCVQELVKLGAVRIEPESSSRSLLVTPLVLAA